jgi:hypothetical protein
MGLVAFYELPTTINTKIILGVAELGYDEVVLRASKITHI